MAMSSIHCFRSTPKLHILVVDDDADTVLSTTILLELWGYVAYPAKNEAESLQILASHHIDVIFVDLAMPGFSGIALATSIQAKQFFPQPLLIVLSGFVDANRRRQAFESGIDIIFTKPVDCNELKRVLEGFGHLTLDTDVGAVSYENDKTGKRLAPNALR
jgi:CheY-like chemotaxis protein